MPRILSAASGHTKRWRQVLTRKNRCNHGWKHPMEAEPQPQKLHWDCPKIIIFESHVWAASFISASESLAALHLFGAFGPNARSTLGLQASTQKSFKMKNFNFSLRQTTMTTVIHKVMTTCLHKHRTQINQPFRCATLLPDPPVAIAIPRLHSPILKPSQQNASLKKGVKMSKLFWFWQA